MRRQKRKLQRQQRHKVVVILVVALVNQKDVYETNSEDDCRETVQESERNAQTANSKAHVLEMDKLKDLLAELEREIDRPNPVKSIVGEVVQRNCVEQFNGARREELPGIPQHHAAKGHTIKNQPVNRDRLVELFRKSVHGNFERISFHQLES